MATDWFVKLGRKEQGPFTPSQIRHFARTGRISESTLLRKANSDRWVIARRIEGLFLDDQSIPESDPGQHKATPSIPSENTPEAWDAACIEEPLAEEEKADAEVSPIVATPTKEEEKTCPFCSESILKTARKCKHCGEFLDTSVPPTGGHQGPVAGRQGPPKLPLPVTILCVVFGGCTGLMLLGGLIGVIERLFTEHGGTSSSPWVFTQFYVEELIPRAHTAEFCSQWEGDVVELGGDRYRVEGWVDVENAFGGTERIRYTVELKFENGSWRVLSADL
ncbi:MAG: hypothetical protein DWQ42_05180 [Planctomycetota bacterium]|nr:MAG: hypothetical protein DWQ42_05180 [Planctomycetota bacterium]REK48387.1 MAG: hypothetical protein DWQ46_02330 [Planctomycetota bacterium]